MADEHGRLYEPVKLIVNVILSRGAGVGPKPVELGQTALRIIQALVSALIVLHLAHLVFSGVFMDEAYYWMWGQHPALSYYDHPGLNAWLLGLSGALFGWDRFALKLPVALAFFADIYVIYLFARRMAGAAWQPQFWLTLLLFLVTPIYWMVTIVAIPDHLLLTLCLFAIYFFFRFFSDRAAGLPGASRDLYLATLMLGLAGLAKYNAAFLGIGVAAFVLIADRRLLREPRLYLAALLSVALQAPTIIWNFTEHFASWEFQLHDRHAGLRDIGEGMVPLLLGILVFISPFLFWPIGRFVLARTTAVPGMGFARTSFIISTVSIVTIAFSTFTLFHWNLVAYAAMLPFLAFYMRPRFLLALQALYGTAFAIAIFVNYSIVPLSDIRGWADEATAWSYDWDQVAAAVEQAKADNHAGFVATPDYTTASLLGFAMRDSDVTSLSAHTEAFDYWFDSAAHAGQDAILFADRWRPLRGLPHHFASVEKLADIPLVLGGRQIDTRHLYLAKGYIP